MTALVVGGVVVLSIIRGGDRDIISERRYQSDHCVRCAAASPSLSGQFVEIIVDATVITVGLAVLGTALTLLIGFALAPLLSELLWLRRGANELRPNAARMLSAARAIVAAPRTLHEVVWALLLTSTSSVSTRSLACSRLGCPSAW
ncbi:MAG: hypothetical protein R2706_01930 [Acidimicrobiales bacterium]